MAKIKGKQLHDATINQQQLNITKASITGATSVTNADYVNENIVNNIKNLTYSNKNLDMLANVATVGDLACDSYIMEFPISSTQVKLNGLELNVGAGKDCYFSPDGLTIRNGGEAQKGDYLYWNDSNYDLEADDELDFIYLVLVQATVTAANETIVINPYYPAINITYTGIAGTSSTLIIDGVSFLLGNVGGSFVWDIGGVNEHTFTTVGEAWLQNVNGEDYTIWYDGLGSLRCSCKKGDFTPILWLNVGTGLTGAWHDVESAILDSDNNYVIVGNFHYYNGTAVNGIVKINQEGAIDTNFLVNTGTGFIQAYNRAYSIAEDQNGKYLITGDFTIFNGISRNNIFRLNHDGTIDNTFISGTGCNGGGGNVIVDSDNKYILTGGFTDYNGTAVKSIIRLNNNGTIDTSLNTGTGFNGIIRKIIIDSNGKYVVGGGFYQYKGVNCSRLTRLNTDGTRDTSFTGLNDNDVYDIIDSNGKYLVTHSYGYYGGGGSSTWERLNQDGSLDTSFTRLHWDGVAHGAIETYEGKYLISGYWSGHSPTNNGNVVKLNSDGTQDTTYVPSITFNNGCIANKIIEFNKKFTFIGPINAEQIIRLNNDGSTNTIYV